MAPTQHVARFSNKWAKLARVSLVVANMMVPCLHLRDHASDIHVSSRSHSDARMRIILGSCMMSLFTIYCLLELFP